MEPLDEKGDDVSETNEKLSAAEVPKTSKEDRMAEGEAYNGWAILSLMGHRQRVGLVSECEAYGGKLLRIDIPITSRADEPQSYITEFYGTASIYSLEPMSEEVARRYVETDPRPVNPVAFREPTKEEVEAEVARRAKRIAYDADTF